MTTDSNTPDLDEVADMITGEVINAIMMSSTSCDQRQTITLPRDVADNSPYEDVLRIPITNRIINGIREIDSEDNDTRVFEVVFAPLVCKSTEHFWALLTYEGIFIVLPMTQNAEVWYAAHKKVIQAVLCELNLLIYMDPECACQVILRTIETILQVTTDDHSNEVGSPKVDVYKGTIEDIGGEQTCLGIIVPDGPFNHGNTFCLTYITTDGEKRYGQVKNMRLEPLEAVLKRGIVSDLKTIRVVGYRTPEGESMAHESVIIVDDRIPKEYLSNKALEDERAFKDAMRALKDANLISEKGN